MDVAALAFPAGVGEPLVLEDRQPLKGKLLAGDRLPKRDQLIANVDEALWLDDGVVGH